MTCCHKFDTSTQRLGYGACGPKIFKLKCPRVLPVALKELLGSGYLSRCELKGILLLFPFSFPLSVYNRNIYPIVVSIFLFVFLGAGSIIPGVKGVYLQLSVVSPCRLAAVIFRYLVHGLASCFTPPSQWGLVVFKKLCSYRSPCSAQPQSIPALNPKP